MEKKNLDEKSRHRSLGIELRFEELNENELSVIIIKLRCIDNFLDPQREMDGGYVI